MTGRVSVDAKFGRFISQEPRAKPHRSIMFGFQVGHPHI